MDDGGSIGPGLLEAEDLICSSGDLDEDEAVSAAWRSLSPAGGVGELGEVWPSLVVHAIHPIFINWGEGHRDNRSGVARLMLPVIFSQAYANKIFSPVSWEENFIWAAFTLPIRSQKKAYNMPKKLAPTHLQETSCWIWSLWKTWQFAGENKVVTFIKRVMRTKFISSHTS